MSVGELLVSIRPDLRGFPAEMSRGLATAGPAVITAFGAIGSDAIRRLGSEVDAGAGAITNTLERIGDNPIRLDLDTQAAEAGLDTLASSLTSLRTLDATVEVTADADAAQAALAGIATSTRTLPDGSVVITADGGAAASVLAGLSSQTQTLPDGTVVVDADVAAAQAALSGVGVIIRSLPDGTVEVTADTSTARRELDDLGGAGAGVGEGLGDGITSGLSDSAEGGFGPAVLGALAAIPIAGSVIGIGVAIGAAIISGLQNEVRTDLFSAQSGLDDVTAQRFGRAAGEAYANNFGESIAGNLDAARSALQAGLLDADANERDSQRIIEQLTGVTDILGEDLPRVAAAAGQLLRTGLAADADEAFDVIVRGAQNGTNVAEDLLDTFIEYPSVLARLGLDAGTATGLLSQGLQAGARNADLVADALKEFQIRATDASEGSAAAFQLIGLSAEDMTSKIASGGAGAREGLQQVLEGLRDIEDPVIRNTAAVGLFGTQAEDLGDALFALDTSTAVAQLGNLEGAASGAISALGDNAASQIASAQRNIEVAADGIKGALAVAFAPQIEGFATYVSENRAVVVGFLLDAANGALDLARALVEAAASGIEGFGEFVTTTGPDVLDLIASILVGLDSIPGVDLRDSIEQFDTMRDGAEASFARIGVSSGIAGSALRVSLIDNGIDPTQERLNAFGIPLRAQAAFHDATLALSNDVADIGYKADGTRLEVEGLSAGFDTTTEAGRALDGQIRDAVVSLRENTVAGREAGQSTAELTADFDANRESLIAQIESLGISRSEAELLAEQYGAVPGLVETSIEQPGMALSRLDVMAYQTELEKLPPESRTRVEAMGAAGSQAAVKALRDEVEALKDKSITITTKYKTSIEDQRNQVNTFGRAGGGWIPGVPSSVDNTLVAMASGEYVVNAADAQRNAALLEAINAGQDVNALLSRATTAATPTETVAVGGGLTAADRELLTALASRPAVLQLGWRQFALAVADVEREKVRVGGH